MATRHFPVAARSESLGGRTIVQSRWLSWIASSAQRMSAQTFRRHHGVGARNGDGDRLRVHHVGRDHGLYWLSHIPVHGSYLRKKNIARKPARAISWVRFE
jgi:hypothetical protein